VLGPSGERVRQAIATTTGAESGRHERPAAVRGQARRICAGRARPHEQRSRASAMGEAAMCQADYETAAAARTFESTTHKTRIEIIEPSVFCKSSVLS
jgi:hypothetical protein